MCNMEPNRETVELKTIPQFVKLSFIWCMQFVVYIRIFESELNIWEQWYNICRMYNVHDVQQESNGPME